MLKSVTLPASNALAYCANAMIQHNFAIHSSVFMGACRTRVLVRVSTRGCWVTGFAAAAARPAAKGFFASECSCLRPWPPELVEVTTLPAALGCVAVAAGAGLKGATVRPEVIDLLGGTRAGTPFKGGGIFTRSGSPAPSAPGPALSPRPGIPGPLELGSGPRAKPAPDDCAPLPMAAGAVAVPNGPGEAAGEGADGCGWEAAGIGIEEGKVGGP